MKDPSEFLGRKLMISTLLEIYHDPGVMISKIAPNTEPRWRTKYIRIHELEVAGLIEFDKSPRKHNTTYIYLTKSGQEIAASLEKTMKIMDEIPDVEPEGGSD